MHGIDWSELIPGGTQAENDAALQIILDQATDWVNTKVEMETLEARTTTETIESRMLRSGEILVYPRNWPINSVDSVRYRALPTLSWIDVDMGRVDVYRHKFVVRGLTKFTLGPNLLTAQDAFFWYRTPAEMTELSRVRMTVEYTYKHGYATLPQAVKTATILYASALIKQRGAASATMNGNPSTIGGTTLDPSDMNIAASLLKPYKRVVVC